MNKRIIVTLSAAMLAGCSSAAGSASTAASAVSATATSLTAVSETVPETLSAEGIISDTAASTITLRTDSTDQTYLKSDDFVCDGVMMVGMPAAVTYTSAADGRNTIHSLSVDTLKKVITGTIADEDASSITVTISVQSGDKDYVFLKADNYYESDGLKQGDSAMILYDGDMEDSPTAASICANDNSIIVIGVIVDEAMSTFQMKASGSGEERGFIKGDNMTVGGTIVRGSQAAVSCHFDNSDCIADRVTVNQNGRSIVGTVKDEAMSTIEITSDGKDYQFLKGDDRVVDDYLTGDTVTVNYSGELDGSPTAYAILKN